LYTIIKMGISEDFINNLSQWLIDNPEKGAMYLGLFYIFGIPLSFPTMPLVFFGAYASSHVYGL